jgi:hypothetical protein
MVQYECYQCNRPTEHVSVAQAARRAHKNVKTIKLWVEKEWVPFVELPSGHVYICSECLLKHRGPSSRGGRKTT